MPGRRRVFVLLLALFLAGGAIAAEPGAGSPTDAPAVSPEPAQPPLPAADSSRDERALLRMLHFEFGLVSACGLADDETRAGYEVASGRLERRLGIDGDAEARFREIDKGWTEADARWAARNGAGFKERCRIEAVTDRNRFHRVFEETGQKLKPGKDGKK